MIEFVEANKVEQFIRFLAVKFIKSDRKPLAFKPGDECRASSVDRACKERRLKSIFNLRR